VSTKNIYMGQIQTETAFVPLSSPKCPLLSHRTLTQETCRYYQPNPNALVPFTPNPSIHDPDFASSCNGSTGNCAVGWGLRVVDSQDLSVYGAGLYSFFDNYDAGELASHPAVWKIGHHR
jgi:glucan 1,3-beta-glucosidase